jgi:putative salt-induced outer membrane protein
MLQRGLIALGALAVLHAAAGAAEPPSGSDSATQGTAGGSQVSATSAPPADTWTANGQLGLVAARGNTTTTSGNASFAAAHRLGLWTLGGGLAALYASTHHITTQEDLSLNLQADRDFGPRAFWFGTGRYDRNLFSGFDYQKTLAGGLGYNFVKSKPTRLSAELGVGYRIQRPIIITLNSAGGIEDWTTGHPIRPQPVVREAVLYAALDYQHRITASTRILNSLLIESGSSDTMTGDDLALQVKIDGSLSLAVGVQMLSNTNPPPGSVSRTDTVMTVNLVYERVNKSVTLETVPQALTSMNLP